MLSAAAAAAPRRAMLAGAGAGGRRHAGRRALSAQAKAKAAGGAAKEGPSNASHIVWAALAMALGIQVAQKTKQMKEWEKERSEATERPDVVREVDVVRVRDLVMAEDWVDEAVEAIKASSNPAETLRLKVRSAFDTVELRVSFRDQE